MVTCCQKCYEIDGEFYALKKTSITRSWYLYDADNATETPVTDAPTISALDAGAIAANERACNLLGGGGGGASCSVDLTAQTWSDPMGLINVGQSNLANGLIQPASFGGAKKLWRAAFYNRVLLAPYTLRIKANPSTGPIQVGIKPTVVTRVYNGSNAATLDGASIYAINGANRFRLSNYQNTTWLGVRNVSGVLVTTGLAEVKLMVDKSGGIIWYYLDAVAGAWVKQDQAWTQGVMSAGELFIAARGPGPGSVEVELCEGGSEPVFA